MRVRHHPGRGLTRRVERRRKWAGEKKTPLDREELKSQKKEAQQKAKEEIEKRFVIEALKQGEGNILRSAEKVGMDRRQFQNLVKKYGISRTGFFERLMRSKPIQKCEEIIRTYKYLILKIISKIYPLVPFNFPEV